MPGHLARESQGTVFVEDSRYEQLCAALARARTERVARRDECFAFIECFVGGLIRFLEVPPDCVRLAPADGSTCAGPLTVGAASSLGEDGTWQTGLQLDIGAGATGAASVVVALVLHIQKKERNFLFKLRPDAAPRTLSGAPDADRSEVYDFVFQQLLASMRGPA
jgi:hypothetical protein